LLFVFRETHHSKRQGVKCAEQIASVRERCGALPIEE
jgi:hypothetical protein